MSDNDLLMKAWEAREYAYPWKSGTKVGCALQTTKAVRLGWNIEGLWQTSIHAEVSAIAKLIPEERIECIAIVAEVKFFVPCGACYDWLAQFASEDCRVLIQGKDRAIHQYKLCELYPLYPQQ